MKMAVVPSTDGGTRSFLIVKVTKKVETLFYHAPRGKIWILEIFAEGSHAY